MAATAALYHQPTVTSVEGGLNFALGHCDCKFISDGAYGWCPTVFAVQGLCERTCTYDVPFRDQGFYWALGWSCAASDPVHAAASAGWSVVDLLVGNLALPFWSEPLRPFASTGQDLFGWLVVPAVPFGVVAAWRTDRVRTAWLASFPAAVAITAALFFGETRFRTVVDLPLVVLAVLGWRTVLRRL
ncbi:MAG: hypothetical protein ABMB14_12575 [Myxococcota bacterium]